MLPRNIPEDINVELLFSYFSIGDMKITMNGLHKRNAYYDIVDMEELRNGTMLVSTGRNSIYNSLPEYLFHPIDRFSNLPKLEEKERFEEEYEKQEKEKELAHRFFSPIDILLLLFRIETREKLRVVTETNSVLINILGDQLTDQERNNRFIKQALTFFPYCKYIRGNKTLLTLLLRKVLTEEGLHVEVVEKETVCTDPHPQYADGLDSELGDSYVGNVYDELVRTYEIHYWPEKCDGQFLKLVDDIEVFRMFIQDYMMSVEEVLHFDISTDTEALRLSDDTCYNYLDYNTNI